MSGAIKRARFLNSVLFDQIQGRIGPLAGVLKNGESWWGSQGCSSHALIARDSGDMEDFITESSIPSSEMLPHGSESKDPR